MVFLTISMLSLHPLGKLHPKAGLPSGGKMSAEIPGFTYAQHAFQKIRECPFLKCFQKGEEAFFIFQKCLTLWPRDLNWVTCSLKSAMS